MGMHSSGHGKFLKKDPDHGRWWRKIRNLWCKWGLCNLDTCTNKDCKSRAKKKGGCKNPDCSCKCGEK